MKKRYLYTLLFGIPGLFLAAITSFAIFGAAAGVLWLFVFGDDPWPAATGVIFPAAFVVTFLTMWTIILARGFVFGKAREADPRFERRHLLIALGATLLPIILMALYQLRVGNLGPQSDSLLCSDYCRDRGYAGSGIPARDSGDRSCLCYGTVGNVVLKIPLDNLPAGR